MFSKLHIELFPYTFRINGIKKNDVEKYLEYIGFKCDNIDKSGDIWWFEDKEDPSGLSGSYHTKNKYITIKMSGELSDEMSNYIIERLRKEHG